MVQECDASFPFLLSFRSNDTGERELGGSDTVTAPFSHLAQSITSKVRYFQPPRRDAILLFATRGVPVSGILFENWLLPSLDVDRAHI